MAFLSIRTLAWTASAAALAAGSCETRAQSRPVYSLDLPAQDLDTALRSISRITGREVIYPVGIVQGVKARRLTGQQTADEAIRALLLDTGLTADFRADVVVIHRSTTKETLQSGLHQDGASPEIVITGTRILGGAVASATIMLSSADIRNAGQNNIGEAMRSLPQSFNGGQNPGVGIGAGGSPANENVGSGSTINLRGLGQDATLTLLNGHRVAYNVASQGVDVSAIPLVALDRVEIVADGASALYGSDAVGGVVNIVLKRDFDGLWTSARYGASTDGGNQQQQYNAVGGFRWGTGGVIAAYDFERDTPITAGQRSYTYALYPDATLLRFQRHHNALVSGHQKITDSVTFATDAVFNKRWTNYNLPVSPTADYRIYGVYGTSETETVSIAPSLRIALPSGWSATLAGVYSQDRTQYGGDFYVANKIVSPTRGCYCNSFDNIEVAGEGPVATLPGGTVRMALGVGYRSNRLHAYRTVGSPQDVQASQQVTYGFAELNLPVVGPSQHIKGVDRLAFNAAIRYEDYADIDRLATPKVGAVYSPFPGVQLKTSWGRSFKAPTLYQQFSERYSSLYLANALGGIGLAPSTTAILLEGANRDLKAERATTWSVTSVVNPPRLAGLRVELSYFNINYRNRVVTPITSRSSSLANAAYTSLVNNIPTASQIGNVVSNPFIFFNYAGSSFDPGKVVAIIDNRYRNAARQVIRGADALLSYSGNIGGETLTASLNATYLDSSQALSAGQAQMRLSGIIFNPPRFRGRAGIGWSRSGNTVSAFLNHIGSVSDDRSMPRIKVDSMTTLDFAAHLDLADAARFLKGLELLLAIQNALNDKPDTIRTSASYLTPYDSTNYSPIGRFVSLSISKRW